MGIPILQELRPKEPGAGIAFENGWTAPQRIWNWKTPGSQIDPGAAESETPKFDPGFAWFPNTAQAFRCFSRCSVPPEKYLT